MPWPVFPQCTAYGFTSLPDYSVHIVERGSGFRSVNRNWYYPLHVYTAVPMGEKPEDDMHRVLKFWHAIGGQAGRFLFKDHVDYKSTQNISGTPSAGDQPLVATSTPGVYQLTKVYRDADLLFEQQRRIQKPKLGTITIAADGVTLIPTTQYTINYDTGLVTFLISIGSQVLTWGGEFWVPVMFETKPEFSITNYKIHSTSFALRELRLE